MRTRVIGFREDRWTRRRACLLALPLSLATLAACCCSPAWAEEARAGWEVVSTSYPTNLAPGGSGFVEVQPFNVGAAGSQGEVTVVDVLPPGVSATDAGVPGGNWGDLFTSGDIDHKLWDCSISAGTAENSVVTCHNDEAEMPSIAGGAGAGPSSGYYAQPPILIAVAAATGAAEGEQSNAMSVSGGGAVEVEHASDPLLISATPATFGPTRLDGWYSKRDGQLDDEAGSVPYAFTMSFALNTLLSEGGTQLANSGGELRDYVVRLPAGFVGDPQAVPTCTREHFDEHACSPEAVVGTLFDYTATGLDTHLLVYNLVPARGLAAQFGFVLEGVSGFVDLSVRSGSDYGITAELPNTPQREVIGATLTLWGVPHDLSHTPWSCKSSGSCPQGASELGAHPTLSPLLRMPTSCNGNDSLSASASGWLTEFAGFTEPLGFDVDDHRGESVSLVGCAQLPFAPSLLAAPTSTSAGSSTGLDFELRVPQPEEVSPVYTEVGGEVEEIGAEPALHEADMKDTSVTFPEGLTLDPSAADGLATCSEQQIGFTGLMELDPAAEPGVATAQFTPTAAACPSASKIATVEVDTPLIAHPLLGSLYLATQTENPFGSLLAGYIAVDDPSSGIAIKLAGRLELNPRTGQITATFDQDPQLPFEAIDVDVFGGARAALSMPTTCGTFATTSLLTPWSAPEGGSEAPSSSFAVTTEPDGGACPTSVAQEPNAPGFSAGALSPIAGAYSAFTLELTRADGSQTFESFAVTLPRGLLGKVAGLERCPQADIEAAQRMTGLGDAALEAEHPSCPAGSEIGTASVGVGSGTPYYMTGRVYFAGPYEGAPFSLVVIAPALAGPFDLGVVAFRAAVLVDPSTAQITVRSDPLPSILYGIPLDIRSIAVELTRPEFTVNPTSCEAMSVDAEETSTSGQTAPLSAHFEAGGCDGLAFKPTLSATTRAKISREDGASLTFSIAARRQTEAGLRELELRLPSKLPPRLSTIERACRAAQFAADPAGCPAGSEIGTATVTTPLLAAPLTGPVYFVSAGGPKFPEVMIVLQGEGITIDVSAKTSISKAGATTILADAVPDAPFTSFTLTLPEGSHSALAAPRGGLCRDDLVLPTALLGQNGVAFKQRTKIEVTGCAAGKRRNAHKLAAAQKRCRKGRSRSCRAKQARDGRRRACKRYASGNASRCLGQHPSSVSGV